MTVIGYIIIALLFAIATMLYRIGNNNIQANTAIRNLLKHNTEITHEVVNKLEEINVRYNVIRRHFESQET